MNPVSQLHPSSVAGYCGGRAEGLPVARDETVGQALDRALTIVSSFTEIGQNPFDSMRTIEAGP